LHRCSNSDKYISPCNAYHRKRSFNPCNWAETPLPQQRQVRVNKKLSDSSGNATVFDCRMVIKHNPNSLFERELVRSVQSYHLQISNQLIRSMKLTKPRDIQIPHGFEILLRTTQLSLQSQASNRPALMNMNRMN
jgi:hypothetical protein